jgi:hypothetical protein
LNIYFLLGDSGDVDPVPGILTPFFMALAS